MENKKLKIIKNKVLKLDKPNILELGVQNGNSTNMFLEICNQNDGYLTSIDIDDCSNVSNDKKFDVLYIDSFHEPNHVKKVFYHYFYFLKKGGMIFIDDVVWLPYVKGGYRDNDFVERINRSVFEKLMEIYNQNTDNLTLDINFNESGLAILTKIGTELNVEKKIKNRLFSLKNIIKRYIYEPKPKK